MSINECVLKILKSSLNDSVTHFKVSTHQLRTTGLNEPCSPHQRQLLWLIAAYVRAGHLRLQVAAAQRAVGHPRLGGRGFRKPVNVHGNVLLRLVFVRVGRLLHLRLDSSSAWTLQADWWDVGDHWWDAGLLGCLGRGVVGGGEGLLGGRLAGHLGCVLVWLWRDVGRLLRGLLLERLLWLCGRWLTWLVSWRLFLFDFAFLLLFSDLDAEPGFRTRERCVFSTSAFQ